MKSIRLKIIKKIIQFLDTKTVFVMTTYAYDMDLCSRSVFLKRKPRYSIHTYILKHYVQYIFKRYTKNALFY